MYRAININNNYFVRIKRSNISKKQLHGVHKHSAHRHEVSRGCNACAIGRACPASPESHTMRTFHTHSLQCITDCVFSRVEISMASSNLQAS